MRPRPGRLEICGEFADGVRLRAVSAFVAGSVRATVRGLGGERSLLPPALFLRARPSSDRFGLYVSRHAFGEDLYAAGRWANLTRYGGRTITTQEQLSLAFESCRIALGEDASDEDLALLARMVAGSEALGIEEEQRPEAPPPVAALMNSALFGGVVDPLSRAGYTLMPVVAPWPLTVFRAVAPGRTAYIAIPRDWLPAFEEAGGAGRLDEVLRAYLGMPPSGRRLASAAQAAAPGIYDEIGPAYCFSPANGIPAPFRRSCRPRQQTPRFRSRHHRRQAGQRSPRWQGPARERLRAPSSR